MSKFESCEFTERVVKAKTSIQNLDGHAHSVAKAKAKQSDNLCFGMVSDEKRLYESQSFKDSGMLDEENSIKHKRNCRVETNLIGKDEKAPCLYLAAYENLGLDKSRQAHEDLASFNPDHIPFQYNKRWEVDTPGIIKKLSDYQLFTQGIDKLESSRFNEFRKEFLAFKNSAIENIPRHNYAAYDSRSGKKGDKSKVGFSLAHHPNLLSYVENKSTSDNDKQNPIPKIQNMMTVTSVEQEISDPSSKNSQCSFNKNLVVRRQDLFECREINSSNVHTSQASLAQSKSDHASLISKKDLKRLSKDPNNIFTRPKYFIVTEENSFRDRIHSGKSRSPVNKSSKSILNELHNINGELDCYGLQWQCRCPSPTIQININSHSVPLSNDLDMLAKEKPISIDIKSPLSRNHPSGNQRSETLKDIEINLTRTPNSPTWAFEHDKKTVTKSLSSINNFQKVLNNKLTELESKMSSCKR